MKQYATKRTLLAIGCLWWLLSVKAQDFREMVSLATEWDCTLLTDDTTALSEGTNFKVQLPGTLDTNRKGRQLRKMDETTRLSRRFSYVGKARYELDIEIPKRWKNSPVFLHMERTKPTQVLLDGVEKGSCDNVSTPHVYNLGSRIKPGKHRLTVIVDNSETAVPKQIVSNSHAYTEDTQTNWNGILGDIYLERLGSVFIDKLRVTPLPEKHEVEITFNIEGRLKKNTRLRIVMVPWGSDLGYRVVNRMLEKTKDEHMRFRFSLSYDSLRQWSEFHPNLYSLRVDLGIHDERSVPFGICDFKANGTQFSVNGQTTFLRGKHDACVFPLTAHVPTDVSTWRHYLQICKGYGINHVRFHSWCPPEACFLAADIEGVYLQPELPFWGDFKKDDKRLMEFLLKEGLQIIREYGHHPSFVMFALGNELWGDIPMMKTFVDTFRKIDSKKLYTFGSNYYLGFQGWKEGMDYFTTCRNGGESWGAYNTHTRGSFSFCDAFDGGLINHSYPNTVQNFSQGIKSCPVPIISHETAQFQTYPDYREITKYRGVLRPCNMEVFRSRLQKAGMLDQAEAFHRASGAWSLQLYKADIEMDLRTPGFGGFQLLDLQDYPGQGSAYVGVLDAFMESKGLTTPSEWRQWCSPVVPLVEMEKYCWTDSETLRAEVRVADYGEQSLCDSLLSWNLSLFDDNSHRPLKQGVLKLPAGKGLLSAGAVSIDMSEVMRSLRAKEASAKAVKLRLSAAVNGTSYRNEWPLWLYPSDVKPTAKSVIVCTEISDEIGKKLQSGASVLLMPDSVVSFPQLTVDGLFQTDYWNYRMFKTISENNKKPVSPGTLGLLMNPNHPLFCEFPTEEHTNWQWFPMVKASHPFMLDNTGSDYRPIVQVIDNIERNHKLGLVFEFQVGSGRLLVCMSPLHQLQQYPEARQFYSSVLSYMQGEQFQPQTRVSLSDLRLLFSTPVVEGKIGELNNISPYQ